jgi:hypothetical protein
MATTILSSETHLAVAVDTRACHEYGDLVNRSIVLGSELNTLHKEFPILLHQTGDTAGFVGHAIMGFDKDENLFVENERWITRTIPASMARGPFSLGYVRPNGNEQQPTSIKVMIDEEHPRLRADGQPVFLQLGGESVYLEGIKRVLQCIDAGLQFDRVLYPELVAMELLEPVDIQISINSEQQYNFLGYYTVNQERLAALSAEQLLRLNRLGLLAPLYFLISSLDNFQRLVDLKRSRAALA